MAMVITGLVVVVAAFLVQATAVGRENYQADQNDKDTHLVIIDQQLRSGAYSVTMIYFNDLLIKAEIDPKTVLIMRHRPTEPGLRKVLPWFAVERPEMFNAYQRAQTGKNTEIALSRATYLAAFLGNIPGIAHFVGLYRRGDYRQISRAEYWAIPENEELHTHGMSLASERNDALWFDLELLDTFSEWQGKLVLEWTGLERSWYRWADRNDFPIKAILDTSAFDQAMPPWNDLVLTWAELKTLPHHWTAALAEWRGIYLIFDENGGHGYVGSAYGGDNILGRWQNYAATGHGGNKLLKKRDPSSFLFSILQRVSPDMEPAEIIRLEASWKERLHTRTHGLNDN
jgi:hypothetical protein